MHIKILSHICRLWELFVVNDDAEIDTEFENIAKDYPNVKLVFFKNDGIYQRTLCFNKIANISTKEVLCFYDTDTVVRPKYLSASQHVIINGLLDHVYPYNGIFVDVKKKSRSDLANFDFDKMESLLVSRELGYDSDDLNVIHNDSVGGIILISKEAFFKIGGYNSEFVGWGFEDVDFNKRSKISNKVSRIENEDAICWHLQHDNTIRTENPLYSNNIKILYNQ